MKALEQNYFKELFDLGLNDKVEQKNGLSYLNWGMCWAEMKKAHPDAVYQIHTTEEGRPWFDDGKTAWVSVTVTVCDVSHKVFLPIMDYKNKSIPAENVTSMDANKAWQRCLVKACAMHGLGLYIYAKMTDSEENLELVDLRKQCMELINKKCALSETAKEKVKEICIAAIPSANPADCNDVEILKTLISQLKCVRK